MALENVQTPSIPRTNLLLLEAIIQGKVTDISNPQNSEYTYFHIAIPSKDQYTNPQTIQVSQPANQRPFARTGDEVKIKVELGGYGRRNNGNLYITNTLNFAETV